MGWVRTSKSLREGVLCALNRSSARWRQRRLFILLGRRACL